MHGRGDFLLQPRGGQKGSLPRAQVGKKKMPPIFQFGWRAATGGKRYSGGIFVWENRRGRIDQSDTYGGKKEERIKKHAERKGPLPMWGYGTWEWGNGGRGVDMGSPSENDGGR